MSNALQNHKFYSKNSAIEVEMETIDKKLYLLEALVDTIWKVIIRFGVVA